MGCHCAIFSFFRSTDPPSRILGDLLLLLTALAFVGDLAFLGALSVSPTGTLRWATGFGRPIGCYRWRLERCTRPRFLLKFPPSGVRSEGIERFEHLVGDKDAVIIVDHGSRRQESNFMLDEFVAMFKARTGYRIVEPAHMIWQEELGIKRPTVVFFTMTTSFSLAELAAPSIRDAFKTCVLQGANRVIVSPFFLSPGRHWQQDIPALAAEASREHSGISYIITAPLGLHELMVDVMNDRIKHCLSHVAGDADECTVCSGTGKCRLY